MQFPDQPTIVGTNRAFCGASQRRTHASIWKKERNSSSFKIQPTFQFLAVTFYCVFTIGKISCFPVNIPTAVYIYFTPCPIWFDGVSLNPVPPRDVVGTCWHRVWEADHRRWLPLVGQQSGLRVDGFLCQHFFSGCFTHTLPYVDSRK